MTSWPFTDDRETRVLTLGAILINGRPILFVEHDERGGWHFFDGRAVFNGSELVMVPFEEIIKRDASVCELSDLPTGWRATRSTKDAAWQRESSALREKTRAAIDDMLGRMATTTTTPPPGFPSTTEILRGERD